MSSSRRMGIWGDSKQGWLGVVVLRDTVLRDVFCRGGEFERGSEVGADCADSFGGVGDPLIEGGADAAALGWILNGDEANEVATGGQAGSRYSRTNGILSREHAVEDEGHIVVFEELGDGEHAFRGFRRAVFGFRGLSRVSGEEICAGGARFASRDGRGGHPYVSIGCDSEVYDFFGYGEDAGLAGDEKETVMRFAAEPAGPVEATVVEGAIETVARQGL